MIQHRKQSETFLAQENRVGYNPLYYEQHCQIITIANIIHWQSADDTDVSTNEQNDVQTAVYWEQMKQKNQLCQPTEVLKDCS